MFKSLFNKVAGLKACKFNKIETPTQVFSCKYCKVFANRFFFRIPSVAGSDLRYLLEKFSKNKISYQIELFKIILMMDKLKILTEKNMRKL